MRKIIALLIVIPLLSASSYSQKNFNFDCYQKYKKCIELNKKDNIPCYFELCSYEQCICKEMTVNNPITHHEDTDPGAWGSAITVCSPWSQSISQCFDEYFSQSSKTSKNLYRRIKEKLTKMINRVKKIKEKMKNIKTRSVEKKETIKKPEKQLSAFKSILKKIDKK